MECAVPPALREALDRAVRELDAAWPTAFGVSVGRVVCCTVSRWDLQPGLAEMARRAAVYVRDRISVHWRLYRIHFKAAPASPPQPTEQTTHELPTMNVQCTLYLRSLVRVLEPHS
jgi:hypothetical protein